MDEKEWVKVFSSGSYHKIELAKAVLNEHEIDSVVVNKQDSVNLFLNTAMHIELYVRNEVALKANHIIDKSLL